MGHILASTDLPSLEHWMVWGPTGVFFGGVFTVGLWMVLDYYRSEIKPRSMQRRINDNEAHKAHLGFIATTSDTLTELKTLVSIVPNMHATQKEHGEDLSWIKKRLAKSDPDRNVLHE